MYSPPSRTRADRCPGVLRPWPADDGGLIRVRVPGGQIDVTSLDALLAVAETYGDRRLRVTGRANLQVRALPTEDGALLPEVRGAIGAAGLLPSPRHDLVRNILASPQTGLAGGRADLRPVITTLDAGLIAREHRGDLPGRFLFTLDDGRGDLADRHRDLGLVALDADRAQLRIGAGWGTIVTLDAAAAAILELADRFLAARGTGPDAAWHVEELATPLAAAAAAVDGADVRSEPLAYGVVPGGRHEHVPEAGLDRGVLNRWLAAGVGRVVITPWHGVLIPTQENS